jgi:hypothetical protein
LISGSFEAQGDYEDNVKKDSLCWSSRGGIQVLEYVDHCILEDGVYFDIGEEDPTPR